MSKHEKKKRMTRADMEQMSTASLEKMLLDDYSSSQSEEADMSELYMAAQILEERGPDLNDSTNLAWEQFRENYLPFALVLSEDGDAPSSDDAHGRRHSPLHQWRLRAALAGALLCALVLSVSVAAAATGFDFLKILAQWTDEQLWLAPGQIDPASKDEIHIPEEPREYTSLQEAFEDCGFTRPVIPKWIPEGFQIRDVNFYDSFPGKLLYQALYHRGDETLVFLIAIHLDDEDIDNRSYIDFQKDEGDPIPYEAGGITHLLSTNVGRPVAVWANGPAECSCSGDITVEELKQMIDSIYE